MNVSKKNIVLLAFAAIASFASASDVTSVSGSNYYTGGWYTGDTMVSLDSTPTNDGDGSLHFVGNGSATVSYGAYPAYGGGVSTMFPSLGTLGALTSAASSMSADFFRSSSSNTINPYIDVSVKLIFSGNRQLTWENAYNSSLTTQDAWFNQILNGSGEWWLRGAGLPAENTNNLHTLSDWATGISPSGYTGTPLSSSSDVLGFALSFGSGVGYFNGAVDHLNVNFAGGNPYAFNFKAQAAPEPASFVAVALGTVTFLRRRKRA